MGIRKRALLWGLLGCCTAFEVRGQVKVTGIVTESEYGAVLYPATIYDSTTGRTVYADSLGHYAITADAGDILIYRYLGFHERDYTIPVGRRHLTHNVVLVSKRLQLKTVEIQALTPYEQDSLERIKTFGHYLESVFKVVMHMHQGFWLFSGRFTLLNSANLVLLYKRLRVLRGTAKCNYFY